LDFRAQLYTGEHFSDHEIRNVYATFFDDKFNIDKDLILLQIFENWSFPDEKSYKIFKSKKLKKIKSYVIPKSSISEKVLNGQKVYSSEVFLDDFNINFEDLISSFDIDPILFLIKNYKDNPVYKELKSKNGAIDLNKKTKLDSSVDYCLPSIYKTEELVFLKPEDIGVSIHLIEEYVDLDYFNSYEEAVVYKFVEILYETNDSEEETKYKNNDYDDNEYGYNEDNYSNDVESYIYKYNLENIDELKYSFFLSLGVVLANVDSEFSDSEKSLIKELLSKELSTTRTNKLIQTVEAKFENNELIISQLVKDINISLLQWEIIELVNNLYALISVDGVASIQELDFIDKITESLHIDFQYKNEIKTKQLLNVEIEDDNSSFAILDVDFKAPDYIQIQQAEDGIIKWNGRLNTLTDPKERTYAQNLINKYSEFIKQSRSSKSTNKSEKKPSSNLSKNDSKWDLLEPLDFPLPSKSTSQEVNKIRKQYPRHRARWSISEEEILNKLYKENYTISQIASGLERTDDAIENKLEKLKLI